MIPLRKLIFLAAALVALVAIYAAAGFWLVPRLVRSNAQEFVSDNYGRTAAIGEIRFNPFTLTLEVDKFAFPDADGQPVAYSTELDGPALADAKPATAAESKVRLELSLK